MNTLKATDILSHIEEHLLRYTDTLGLRIIRAAYLYLEDPVWYRHLRNRYPISSTDVVFNEGRGKV